MQLFTAGVVYDLPRDSAINPEGNGERSGCENKCFIAPLWLIIRKIERVNQRDL